jgi:hypothetical protein
MSFWREAALLGIGVFVAILALLVGGVMVLFVLTSSCFGPADPKPVVIATSTPEKSADALTAETPVVATATPQVPSPTATSTAVALATSTPTPAPRPPEPAATPSPLPTNPPAPSPASAANFSGDWTVVDSVSQGQGVGQTFTFDVTLVQSGSRLSGGNSGLVIDGTVSGRTATASFVQPALGHTGTFSWSMRADGNAEGSFSSSVPNSGSSRLVRR